MTQKIQIIAGQDQHLGALYRPCDDKNLPDRSELLIVMVHGFPGHKASNNDLYGDLEFLLADKGFELSSQIRRGARMRLAAQIVAHRGTLGGMRVSIARINA